jgi:hypothetical protein
MKINFTRYERFLLISQIPRLTTCLPRCVVLWVLRLERNKFYFTNHADKIVAMFESQMLGLTKHRVILKIRLSCLSFPWFYPKMWELFQYRYQ